MMKKLLFLLLLLFSSTFFSGCELFSYLFVMWACPGEEEPKVWVTNYPLEQGEYWIFENKITITEYDNEDHFITMVVERRDSVVVIGEDELPNGIEGILVVDFWSTVEDTGEIHHFYKQQDDGLYCLAVKYENGMDTYRNPITPNMSFFIEMSPLPGHAILNRESYHEDGFTIESPMRKVMEAEYTQKENYYDEFYGSYFENSNVYKFWEDFKIWKCCVIRTRYSTDDGTSIKKEDFLATEGIVWRRITIGSTEILDEEGEGTGIFRRYNAVIELVDGTYQR